MARYAEENDKEPDVVCTPVRRRLRRKTNSSHAVHLTSRRTKTWLIMHRCMSLRDWCGHRIAGKTPTGHTELFETRRRSRWFGWTIS